MHRQGISLAVLSIGLVLIPLAGFAQTGSVNPPLISIDSLTQSLPQPFLDFINSTKQLSDNAFSSLDDGINISIDIPATKEWFSSPENFWNRLDAWIYDHTGISLNAIWGFIVGFIKAILGIFVWLLNFVIGIVEYLIGLIS